MNAIFCVWRNMKKRHKIAMYTGESKKKDKI
jgi:hypothetical protein